MHFICLKILNILVGVINNNLHRRKLVKEHLISFYVILF
jgi:hypothetical protein